MTRMRLREKRGAATVEFAIIAAVLLTLVFGIIELGVLMFDKHILTNASREGARAGIVMRIPRVSDAAIIDKVNGYAKKYMVTFGTPNDPDVKVTRTWLTTDPPTILKSGDELVVEVTYNFDFLFLSFVGLGPITLTADTRMRME